MISGVNSDLLSKIGAGGAKKNAPSGSKLGKTSTAADANPSPASFGEQLDLARPLAPRLKKMAASPAPQEPIAGVKPSSPEPFLMPMPESKPAATDLNVEDGAVSPALSQKQSLKAPVKSDETVAVLEPVATEQGQVRRQAMQDFMNQMQREFGIPPEKIVEAFSRLDEQALMRPPEESTKQFLANLEVPAAKLGRAAELYNSMLRTTGEAALNEKLAGAEQGVKMSVLSPRDEALRKLNEAIDQLNNSFALRGQAQMTSLAAPLDNPLKAQLALERMNTELAKMEKIASPDGATMAATRVNQPAGDESDDSAMALLADDSSSDSWASASLALAGAVAMPRGASVGGDSASAMSQQFGRGENGRSQPEASEINSSASMKKSAPATEAAKSFAKKLNVEATTERTEAAVANSDAAVAGAEAQTAPTAAKAAGPAGMIIERPTPTAQDEQANVKELIRQAQLAIKKGGGEIKMDLKPEGIGQLHLKVSVENGQVNVQMLTENDASKRLLEKGLQELKSNLAAHELKVDTMKVDVGQELKKHMDNSGDQAREQTRQFAADVMSQFREERQAFRDGFMQNQGWRQFGRNYGQPESGRGSSGSAETTAAASSASARARARNAYSSGRLDLVA